MSHALARMGALCARMSLVIGLFVIGPHSGAVAATEEDYLDQAMALVREGDRPAAAELIERNLSGGGGPLEAHVLLGEILLELDRPGAAAEAWGRGLAALAERGEDGTKEFKNLRGRVEDIDPLARARRALVNKVLKLLVEDSLALAKQDDHALRALDFLTRIHPICLDGRRAELGRELERVRKKFEVVDLDAAGGGERLEVRLDSLYYRLVAELEESVAGLVGDTMDSIFESYIQIYLNGERTRIPDRKVVLRIHATHAEMLSKWPGENPSPGLGGWWSPMEQRVVCYDTRDDHGSLDAMLGTLFHEASHQFMTVLATRGGWSPAWLNEGTASFFEGARAMADRRVLWPDAAIDRLRNLVTMLPMAGQGAIPTFEDVIAFDQPGSYPGEYYAWGWGIVYYLQEYEDPDTLDYVWRPYYDAYKERITVEGGDPKALFEEVFLAEGNPAGVRTMADFAAEWRSWILNTVRPLQMGEDRRELRLARAERYLAASQNPRGGITHEDLVLRSLRDVEYVRTQIDDEPDAAVLEQQIVILRELGRTAAEAAILEELLDMVDDGALEMSESEYTERAERMYAIDKENELPRKLKVRAANQKKRARELLARYEELDPPLPERTLSFAAEMGVALDDRQLLAAAERLHTELTGSEPGAAAPVVSGTPIAGTEWVSMFPEADEDRFSASPSGIEIASDDGEAARICMDQPFSGRWVVRGWLTRGEGSYRSGHGVVLAGAPGADWLVAKVDRNDVMTLERWRLWDGEPDSERLERVPLEVEEDSEVWIECTVDWAQGTVDVTFEPGEDPERIWIEDRAVLPSEAYVGVFTQKAETRLRDLSVEQLP